MFGIWTLKTNPINTQTFLSTNIAAMVLGRTADLPLASAVDLLTRATNTPDKPLQAAPGVWVAYLGLADVGELAITLDLADGWTIEIDREVDNHLPKIDSLADLGNLPFFVCRCAHPAAKRMQVFTEGTRDTLRKALEVRTAVVLRADTHHRAAKLLHPDRNADALHTLLAAMLETGFDGPAKRPGVLADLQAAFDDAVSTLRG